MKRVVILLLVIVVAAVVGGAIYYRGKPPNVAPQAATTTVFVPVSVIPVRASRIVDRMTAYGNLVPQRTVNIVPNAPGQIMKILFTDGQKVQTGDPLVVMDDRIAKAQVQSSQAQADADVLNLRRTEALANRSFDSTRSLEQAQSRSAMSQAELLINQSKLDQLTLRAPFAGTLGTHHVDQGAYINGDQTIVRLDDTSQLQIEFRMPSSVARRAADGMPVHLRVPGAAADLERTGRLSFIDPVVSTDTRSVLLRALVQNDNQPLRPGVFVDVGLDLEVHENALVVPTSAVMLELSGSYVFVVDEHNIARRRPVKRGITDDTSTEITEGLKAGERIVTVGQFRLSDGDAVKIVPAIEAAPAKDPR